MGVRRLISPEDCRGRFSPADTPFPAPDEERKFLARPVEVGPLRGDLVTIRSGVQAGEVVVTEGSFFLRAEMLRNAPAGS